MSMIGKHSKCGECGYWVDTNVVTRVLNSAAKKETIEDTTPAYCWRFPKFELKEKQFRACGEFKPMVMAIEG